MKSGCKEGQHALIWGTLNGSLAKDMVLGTFIVTFAVQVLELPPGTISAYLAIVPLVILLRYPLLSRISHYPRMSVLILSRWIMLTCLAALFLLPDAFLNLPILIAIGMLFVFGSDFLQNAVWMNVVYDVTTPADRGRFLGRLRGWKQATNMAFSVFAFALVGAQMNRAEFNTLLIIVACLLANSLFWYARIPATSVVRLPKATPPRFVEHVKTHPMLRGPLLLAILGNVILWPVLVVFFVSILKVPANLIVLSVGASMLGSIVSEWKWGVAADEYGIAWVYSRYFSGSLLVLPLLVLIPDFSKVSGVPAIIGTVVLLLFHFLRGVLEAGNQMAMAMYRATYLNRVEGYYAINALTAIQQVFLAAFTAVGGIVLSVMSAGAAPLFALIWIDPFRILTISAIGAAACLGLYSLKKLADL